MTHYQNLILKPDMMINIYQLRNKIFSKLHQALYDLKADNIGISFPKATEVRDKKKSSTLKLGNVIRLHSELQNLQKLNNLNWFGSLASHCTMEEAQPVPDTVNQYRIYSRKQPHKSNAKLQRMIKRHNLNSEQIKNYQISMYTKELNMPFIQLKSTSTREHYRLFINIGSQSQPQSGTFNHYGLSQQATVPYF